MSEITSARSLSKLLIPLTGGIALSLAGCGDDEPGLESSELTEAEAANDYMASVAAEFCQIRENCYPDGFSDEYDSFEDCVDYLGVAFRAEAYAVNEACGEAFMAFARCSGSIWLDAYEGQGCDYRDHIGDYGATLIEEYSYDEPYYFACPDEYDRQIDECGYL